MNGFVPNYPALAISIVCKYMQITCRFKKNYRTQDAPVPSAGLSRHLHGELPQYDLLDLQGRRDRQIFSDPSAGRARPPAKPARHSPEAKPMADGKGEAAWGTSGQAYSDVNLISLCKNLENLCSPARLCLRPPCLSATLSLSKLEGFQGLSCMADGSVSKI